MPTYNPINDFSQPFNSPFGGVTGAIGTSVTVPNGGYGVYTSPTYTYNTQTYSYPTVMSVSGNIYSTGDINTEGDVKFKGRSLSEALDAIEERLAILRPNSELEERWNKLKELGIKYKALEKDLLEKEAMWNTLTK